MLNEIIKITRNYFKPLMAINFAILVISVLILLTLDPWFKSTAVVLIEDDNQSSLMGAISESIPLNFGFTGGNQSEKFLGFLQTRRVQEEIIEEFELAEVYDKESRDEIFKELSNNTILTNNENSTISITVIAKNDPDLAANIANRYFKLLDELLLETNNLQAKDYREFLQTSYLRQKTQLDSVETAFQKFQENTGLFNLGAQISSSLEALGELELNKIRLEIELEKIKSTTTEKSNNQAAIKNNIRILKEKIDNLNFNTTSSIVADLNTLPSLGKKYADLKRSISVGSKVTEYLRLQLEQATLQENKQTTNLYLLDPAQVSDKKFKPSRSRILILIVFLGAIGTLILAKLYDSYRKGE